MNFRRGSRSAEPEINLIPHIDVVLVIIIFLMLTTTFSKVSGLEINLPTAESEGAESVAEDNDLPYAISSYDSTSPSEGKSFLLISDENLASSSSTVSLVTI